MSVTGDSGDLTVESPVASPDISRVSQRGEIVLRERRERSVEIRTKECSSDLVC